MIDTDIYEGHTEGPWRVENGSIHAKADWWSGVGDMIFFSKRHGQDANSQLVADAPLLLEEVKRLQKELRKQTNIIGMISDLVYDGGSHNLTWDELNEILGDVVKE